MKTNIDTEKLITDVSKTLKLQDWQVKNTINLLAEDCTIPFIARYRKEMTNSLDEETIINLLKV